MEDAEKDAEKDEGSELATPAPGAGRRRAGSLRPTVGSPDRRRLVIVALAAATTVLLVLTVLFAVLWSQADSEQGDTDAVRRSAGEFAQRFLEIDTTDLDAWKRRVLERSTGALKRDFDEGLETAVVQSILALAESAKVEATVDDLYVGEIDSRVARVIVEVETTTIVRNEGKDQTFPNRVFMALDLVKQDGAWLVDGLQSLNFQAGTTPASGSRTSGSTTSTATAPAPSTTGQPAP